MNTIMHVPAKQTLLLLNVIIVKYTRKSAEIANFPEVFTFVFDHSSNKSLYFPVVLREGFKKFEYLRNEMEN